MNLSTLTGFTAGVLQFVVAAYALRLNRLFGTTRVGWSLFCAFTLLALLHLAQIIQPINGAISFETEVEVIYALVSLLLLTGMIHLETLLKERNKMEKKEQQLRAELEQEVKKKTAYLTRAIEELQAEIDERKRMETVVESTDFELRAASRQIELASLANRVLHMAGNSLTDIKAIVERITNRLRDSRINHLIKPGNQPQAPLANSEQLTARHPENQKLSHQINQLADDLRTEQSNTLNDLDELKNHVGKVVWMRQNYIQLADTLNQITETTPPTDAAFTTRSPKANQPGKTEFDVAPLKA